MKKYIKKDFKVAQAKTAFTPQQRRNIRGIYHDSKVISNTVTQATLAIMTGGQSLVWTLFPTLVSYALKPERDVRKNDAIVFTNDLEKQNVNTPKSYALGHGCIDGTLQSILNPLGYIAMVVTVTADIVAYAFTKRTHDQTGFSKLSFDKKTQKTLQHIFNPKGSFSYTHTTLHALENGKVLSYQGPEKPKFNGAYQNRRTQNLG